MKKEQDRCKDCSEYGSEFCPECLDEQPIHNKLASMNLDDKIQLLNNSRKDIASHAKEWLEEEHRIDLPPLRIDSSVSGKSKV